MKISDTQYKVDRWGDEKYKKLKEIGFEAIDFSNNVTDSHAHCEISNEEFIDTVKREKELIDEAGLEVYQMHGPWRWPPRDYTPEDRTDRMSRMKASIEASALLGCKNWVIHNIMPFGHEDLKLGKGEETWKMNKEFFGELADTAHKFEVNICLENMPPYPQKQPIRLYRPPYVSRWLCLPQARFRRLPQRILHQSCPRI